MSQNGINQQTSPHFCFKFAVSVLASYSPPSVTGAVNMLSKTVSLTTGNWFLHLHMYAGNPGVVPKPPLQGEERCQLP